MKILVTLLILAAGTNLFAQQTAERAQAQPKDSAAAGSDTLAVQVMLDRAGFSPGVIDGQPGRNFSRAIAAFQRAHSLSETGTLEPQTLERLTQATGSQPPLAEFVLREEDVAGPFTPRLPSDLMAQSKYEALNYQEALERVAERFHTTPQLLRRLNPSASFDRAGERLMAPNVEPFELPQPAAAAPKGRGGKPEATATSGVQGPRGRGAAPAVFRIAVTKSTSALTVEDESGKVIFHAPVTTGSEHDPLPLGTWKVTTVQLMPAFHYNPDLFWDADPSHSKAKLAPGPNNPVGVAWIGLSKEHYGIHGTPEPSRVGHLQSHGCVRLTNWDVQRLLQWVQPGSAVIFRE